MRIVAGLARGCSLFSPGKLDIRPTPDKVRQALFNMIDPADAAFLDLFCGTGAVGCEAVSRGASLATLVESDRRAVELAKRNVGKVLRVARCETPVRVAKGDALKFTGNPSPRKYRFVFCDPPYTWGAAQALLDNLEQNGFVEPDGLVVYECARKHPPQTRQTPERVKQYGDTALLFFRF
jgi:16S rRNA (guanine(966)-N(2))-methyltransferase RsmD